MVEFLSPHIYIIAGVFFLVIFTRISLLGIASSLATTLLFAPTPLELELVLIKGHSCASDPAQTEEIAKPKSVVGKVSRNPDVTLDC